MVNAPPVMSCKGNYASQRVPLNHSFDSMGGLQLGCLSSYTIKKRDRRGLLKNIEVVIQKLGRRQVNWTTTSKWQERRKTCFRGRISIRAWQASPILVEKNLCPVGHVGCNWNFNREVGDWMRDFGKCSVVIWRFNERIGFMWRREGIMSQVVKIRISCWLSFRSRRAHDMCF